MGKPLTKMSSRLCPRRDSWWPSCLGTCTFWSLHPPVPTPSGMFSPTLRDPLTTRRREAAEEQVWLQSLQELGPGCATWKPGHTRGNSNSSDISLLTGDTENLRLLSLPLTKLPSLFSVPVHSAPLSLLCLRLLETRQLWFLEAESYK